MARGKVKWFNAAKGFGFIVSEESDSKDVFVHYTSIEMDGFRTLKEGEEVEYDLVVSDRGPQASNVRHAPEG